MRLLALAREGGVADGEDLVEDQRIPAVQAVAIEKPSRASMPEE